MSSRRSRVRAAALLFALPLLLTACTEGVVERCRGVNGEYSCTITYETSDGQWGTRLESDKKYTDAVVSGTVTLESGSGTLVISGSEEAVEYDLVAGEPLVLEDVGLSLSSRDDETWLSLEVTADPRIDGFTAEIDWVVS